MGLDPSKLEEQPKVQAHQREETKEAHFGSENTWWTSLPTYKGMPRAIEGKWVGARLPHPSPKTTEDPQAGSSTFL